MSSKTEMASTKRYRRWTTQVQMAHQELRSAKATIMHLSDFRLKTTFTNSRLMCVDLQDVELAETLMNAENVKQAIPSTLITIVVLMVVWIVTRLIACNVMKVFLTS